jgi:hypothetical protein
MRWDVHGTRLLVWMRKFTHPLSVEVRMSPQSGIPHAMIRNAVETFIPQSHDVVNIPDTLTNWHEHPILGQDVELIHITESGTSDCVF